ncbi:phage holin [Diplocloster agilis]|uniref:Phage holin n=1 Tax=Diplocloster agilis TaxID=2850323 RepID=A0A949NH87_9FIRM|nr:phage holin [Diplocloster agilis]MBU9735810.1 phage holin [Diplocloster agilis]MBU9742842.1 phage holin [Diplocloster agilis]
MKQINWKVRIQNKTTLTAIIMATIALIYQICGLMGIVPPIAESELVKTAGMIINLLVLLGIVTDPTTAGIKDSRQAMTYEEPRDE